MIGKKNRVRMKEPCGAIKERRLIRSRIQHRRQNLFHTSRKFKTKQNPINWKKYNANLWRKFPKSYVVAMSAVCCLLSGRERSLGCREIAVLSGFIGEIDPARSRAMTLCGSQRAAEERYSERAVTRWNPGLFSQPLHLITFCDFWNDPVLRIALLVLANSFFIYLLLFSMFLASLGKKNNNK